jgi:hypothetical protein
MAIRDPDFQAPPFMSGYSGSRVLVIEIAADDAAAFFSGLRRK